MRCLGSLCALVVALAVVTGNAATGDAPREEIEQLKREIAELRAKKAKEEERLAALSVEELATEIREKRFNGFVRKFDAVKILMSRLKPGLSREFVRSLTGKPNKIDGNEDHYSADTWPLPGGREVRILSYKDDKLTAMFGAEDYSHYQERGLDPPQSKRVEIPLAKEEAEARPAKRE